MSAVHKRQIARLKIRVDIDDMKAFRLKNGRVEDFFSEHSIFGLTVALDIKRGEYCDVDIGADKNESIYRAAALFQQHLADWWHVVKNSDVKRIKSHLKASKSRKSSKYSVDINVNSRNGDGVTALMFACGHRGYSSIGKLKTEVPNGRLIDLLMTNGADATIADSKGKSALDLVSDRPAIAAMLKASRPKLKRASTDFRKKAGAMKRKSTPASVLRPQLDAAQSVKSPPKRKSASSSSSRRTRKSLTSSKRKSEGSTQPLDLTLTTTSSPPTLLSAAATTMRGGSSRKSGLKASASSPAVAPKAQLSSDYFGATVISSASASPIPFPKEKTSLEEHSRRQSGLIAPDITKMRDVDMVSLLFSDAADIGLPMLPSKIPVGTDKIKKRKTAKGSATSNSKRRSKVKPVSSSSARARIKRRDLTSAKKPKETRSVGTVTRKYDWRSDSSSSSESEI